MGHNGREKPFWVVKDSGVFCCGYDTKEEADQEVAKLNKLGVIAGWAPMRVIPRPS